MFDEPEEYHQRNRFLLNARARIHNFARNNDVRLPLPHCRRRAADDDRGANTSNQERIRTQQSRGCVERV